MAEGTSEESEGRIQLEDVRQTVTCGICLQLYTDPRSLTCSHSYCLVCLKGFQTSSHRKECPVCRAETIPSKHDLHKLPVNKLATDLVKLVHTYEPSAVEDAPEWKKPSPVNSESKSPAGGLSSDSEGDLNTAIQRLFGLLHETGIESDDLMGLLHRTLEDGIGHVGVQCNVCGKSSFDGARFKCGICEDFDLCEECEKKPRHEIHQKEYPHVFVKIKKPSTSPYPKHRVLDEDAEVMGMTMDITKQEHSLQLSETETKNITCANCQVSPIVGVRFKCGACQDYDLCENCEKTSEEFHDDKHVFMVFKHPVSFHTTTPQLTYDFYFD